MTCRIVLAVQLAFLVLVGGGIRGWFGVPGGGASDPHLETPEWLEVLVSLFIIAFAYPLPLWGVAAAWWSGVREGKLVLVVGVELLMWFAMMVALLPAVQ